MGSLKLCAICEQLDEDKSGHLSYKELAQGFHTHPEFASILRTMDISEQDLEVLFGILDTDGSGDVQYSEFVEQLHAMKHHEANTLLVFIKFYVMELRKMFLDLQQKRGPEPVSNGSDAH